MGNFTEPNLSVMMALQSPNSVSPCLQDSPLQYDSALTPPAVESSLPHRAARFIYEEIKWLERFFCCELPSFIFFAFVELLPSEA